ncbi:MAG: FkbM family methyltransferase [Opitutaceae bacterium]
MNPVDAASRYGADSLFVVTAWGAHATDSMSDRICRWRDAGCRGVTSFLPLYWKYPEELLPFWTCDLPHRVVEAADRIRGLADLWSDEASRRQFRVQLRWRLDGDFAPLALPAPGSLYFSPEFIRLRSDERVVDCGAYDGDTLRDFLARTGAAFGRYTALEPDPENFRRFAVEAARQDPAVRDRIRLLPVAAHHRRETLRFAASGDLSSAVGRDGSVRVQGETLDAIIGSESPTFIKLDIEGAEIDALRGAAGILAHARPVVAVSVYHRQSHLWEIPELLRSMVSDYAFFLVPHVRDGWDLVCYAVPKERLDGRIAREGL